MNKKINLKKLSQPMLTWPTSNLRYEMRITPQKKIWTIHKAHSPISQCQMIKKKKNSKKDQKNIELKPGKSLKLVNQIMRMR